MVKPICQAFACQFEISAKHLMCKRHWSMVPQHIQSEVYRLYKYKSPSREYLAAVKDARAAVETKEREMRIDRLLKRSV